MNFCVNEETQEELEGRSWGRNDVNILCRKFFKNVK